MPIEENMYNFKEKMTSLDYKGIEKCNQEEEFAL